MIAAFLIVLLGESFTALGQTLYKRNTNRLETHSLKTMRSYFAFMKDVLLLPGIWLGLLSMAAGLIIWLTALSRFDLSFVFPASSILYVLILFASRIFLREKIDSMKLVGTSLVIIGIIVITLG